MIPSSSEVPTSSRPLFEWGAMQYISFRSHTCVSRPIPHKSTRLTRNDAIIPGLFTFDLHAYFDTLLNILRLIPGKYGSEPLQTEEPWPIPRHIVAHRGREERGTTSSIASYLELLKRQKFCTLHDFYTTFWLRIGRAAKGSDIWVQYGVIRVCCAILAGLSCIAHTLQCTSDTDTSKPSNHRYYVLQSRCNVPSLYL